jgi:hypothetical protein
MNHLLFECSFARFVWQMVVCAFGFVRPPENADDMLGAWISSFPAPLRKSILCGCTAVCWTIGSQEMMHVLTENSQMTHPSQFTDFAMY